MRCSENALAPSMPMRNAALVCTNAQAGNLTALGESGALLMMNPHPTNDSHVTDCLAIGFGNRLHDK